MSAKSRPRVAETGGERQTSSKPPGDKTNESLGGEQIDGDWFERTDHPLLNDLVLPMIFGYVRGKDLKSCRLVNKKWNILSIPFTRTRLQVSIWSSRRYSSDAENPKGITSFMEVMRLNILGIPFGRYDLGSFDATRGFGPEFVQLCGDMTKELILSDCDCKVESISAMLRSMPNLESISLPHRLNSEAGTPVQLFPGAKPKLNFLKSLFVRGEDTEARKKICPTFYDELLGAAPNISTFSLFGCTGNKNARLDVLETLEKLGRESSIENLTHALMEADVLALLRKMASNGMKLKKLHFIVPNSFDWLGLVTLFKDSLISLNIGFSFHSSTRRTIIFPTMPKLAVLQLEISPSTKLSCQNFPDTFPALEELLFLNCWDRTEFKNFITRDESTTMKKLIVKVCPTLTMERFNRILSVFPVLSSLEIYLREDTVEVIRNIWNHMTQLQELHIQGSLPSSENLESLVTGIPLQQMVKTRATGSYGLLEKATAKIQRENILERMMVNKGLRPSIGNLKNLRSLSLNLYTRGSGIKCLTDFSAYLGLYSIKTLRHLSLSECQFSKRCCEILINDMNLVTWNIGSRTKLFRQD